MASLNKAQVIGNLGKDPEMKYTSSGTAVTKFSVAATFKWKDANGEAKEQTEWFNIVAWNKLAEVCNEYLHKGSKVYIEGRLQTSSWEKDGQKHYKTEVVATQMIMLDSRQASGKGQAPDDDGDPFA